MKKRVCIVLLALLCLGFAWAEEVFYTNNEDRYYHADPDCDRPAGTSWTGQLRDFYPREAYNKYEISAEAAAEFEKMACPVCVLDFDPVYLGKHMPEWKWETEPWGISGDDALGMEIREALPKAYFDESAGTHQAFEAFYEEVYDQQTQNFVRRNPYPEAFAGNYVNISGTMTYGVVNPTPELLNSFERLFGGGAWIVPAKYGWNEMYAEQDRIFDELTAWCAAHPEAGAHPSSAGIDVVENRLIVGISGANWQQAAAAFDGEVPPYVCFVREDISFAAAEGK